MVSVIENFESIYWKLFCNILIAFNANGNLCEALIICLCSVALNRDHWVYTTPIDFYLIKKKVPFISVE